MASKRRKKAGSGTARRPSDPAPAGTAPNAAIATRPAGQLSDDGTRIELTRGAALPAMQDPSRRKEWGLPEDARERGPYMVELNLRHPQGLTGAARMFVEHLFPAVVKEEADRSCEPVTSAYFRCQLNVAEWRDLIRIDEDWEQGRGKPPGFTGKWARCIYRVWPDFRIRALVDRSVMTVKADAASRSYEANGRNIVWAVVDSGIEANHPHFGPADDANKHLLRNPDVAELHRDFTKPDGCAVNVPKSNIAAALHRPVRARHSCRWNHLGSGTR